MSLLRPAIRSLLTATLLAATVQTAVAHPGDGRWGGDRDDEERGDYARVLDSRPHYVEVRVDVPQRRCWNGRGADEGDRRVGGTLLGGLIGGVLGHNLAGGEDRGFGTAAGAVVGGLIGHEVGRQRDEEAGGYERNYGRDDRRDYRDYRDDRGDRGDRGDRDYRGERCRTVMIPRYERRVDGYDVVYEYEGRRYRTHLPYDPGPRLDLRAADAPAWR